MADPTTTTPPPTDDAAPHADGTPAEQGRNAEDEEKGKLIAALQEKAAVTNRLMAHYGVTTVEELNAILAQPPAATGTTVQTPTDDDDYIDPRDIEAAQGFATSGDAVAKLAAKLAKRVEKLEGQTRDGFTAVAIADEQERNQARLLQQKYPGHFPDLQSAHDAIRRRKLELETEKLRKEKADLEARLAVANKRPDPDVLNAPRTAGREITAGESNQPETLTFAQFDARAAALRAAGNNLGALLLQKQLDEGKIILR